MKKSILFLGGTLFLILAAFSGCQSSTSKLEKAKDKVQEAKMDLADSQTELYLIRLDTISKYEQFKIEAEKIIIAQEKSISEIKARIATENKEINADYDKTLVLSEKKNSELKTKLADFKDDGQDKWIDFKNEFNHDINELGKTLKDLTVENVK